jgi:hypothetical protein
MTATTPLPPHIDSRDIAAIEASLDLHGIPRVDCGHTLKLSQRILRWVSKLETAAYNRGAATVEDAVRREVVTECVRRIVGDDKDLARRVADAIYPASEEPDEGSF